MVRALATSMMFLCAGVALAADPTPPATPQPATSDPDAARRLAEVQAGEEAIALATRLRADTRSEKVPPVAVFGRLNDKVAWTLFPTLDAMWAWAPDEGADYIIVRRGLDGLRLVTAARSTHGDAYNGQDYVFAADGHLLQFAQIAEGWGDACGDYRSEGVWDFFSDQKVRRSYTVTLGDGGPLDQERKGWGCRVLDHRKDLEPPRAVPTWMRWSDVPVSGLVTPTP